MCGPPLGLRVGTRVAVVAVVGVVDEAARLEAGALHDALLVAVVVAIGIAVPGRGPNSVALIELELLCRLVRARLEVRVSVLVLVIPIVPLVLCPLLASG